VCAPLCFNDQKRGNEDGDRGDQSLIDTGDTAWMLTSTALVLFMTLPGLALFYGGLVRSKNVLSVLMQCFAIAGIVSILWLVIGYSLAFRPGNAFIGDLGRMLMAGVGRDTLTGSIPEPLFMLFQMTFAIITPALVIGAFAERSGCSWCMCQSPTGSGGVAGSSIWDCMTSPAGPSFISAPGWPLWWRPGSWGPAAVSPRPP
jgi:hypothetical protein